MKLRFFMCSRCEEYYAGYTDKKDILCGALVGFTENETPLGCGGKLNETTQEEATEAAYRRRDDNG